MVSFGENIISDMDILYFRLENTYIYDNGKLLKIPTLCFPYVNEILFMYDLG